jgi:hypothetical protein
MAKRPMTKIKHKTFSGGGPPRDPLGGREWRDQLKFGAGLQRPLRTGAA